MKFVEPPPNEAFLPDSLIRAGWRCPSGGAGVLPSVLAPRRRLHVTPAHALGFLTIVDLASDSVALGFEDTSPDRRLRRGSRGLEFLHPSRLILQ